MAVVNAEAETMQLTLKVPPAVAKHIRQQVSTGVYKNENDSVESILLSNVLFEHPRQEELVHWMNTEGASRCEAMDADPGNSLSHERFWKSLDESEDESEENSA